MTEEHLDLTISRLATGEADSRDWHEFQRLAEESPELWRELALAQRDHAEIVRSINGLVAVADRIDLGALAAEDAPRPFRLDRWLGGAGWAAAAVIALVIIVRGMAPTLPDGGASSVELARTPDAALEEYLAVGRESGRVVGEVPQRVLLDRRPLPDGEGYELLYLRQIIERRTVPELYHFDEQSDGGATLARWNQPAGDRM